MGTGLDNAAGDLEVEEGALGGRVRRRVPDPRALARGGSGSVFRAERLRDKMLCPKVLSASKARNTRVVSRFHQRSSSGGACAASLVLFAWSTSIRAAESTANCR